MIDPDLGILEDEDFVIINYFKLFKVLVNDTTWELLAKIY